MLAHERFYFVHREQGVFRQIIGDIVVIHIEPELVECERRCFLRIEPHGVAFGFAEFLAGLLVDDERRRDRVHCLPRFLVDEFNPRRDVGPLVGTANLQVDAVAPIEMHIIVRLQERICEFGV